MNYEVTRDIVNDLWPLCRNGDASPDSRGLVDRFLAEDADFAATLRESARLGNVTGDLRLSPDAERRLLDDARGRARLKLFVIGGSVAAAFFLLVSSLIVLLFVLGRAG